MLHHVACHISMNPGRGVDWQFWNEVQYLGHVLIRALVFGQPSKQHLSSYQYGDNLCFRFPWWFPWVYSVVLVEPDDTIVSSTGFQLPGGCWWRGCLYVAISTNLCRRWDKLQRRSPRSWRGRDALLCLADFSYRSWPSWPSLKSWMPNGKAARHQLLCTNKS